MAFPFVVIYLFFVLVRPHEWVFIDAGDSQIIQYCLLMAIAAFVPQQEKNFSAPPFSLMIALFMSIVLSLVFISWFSGAITFGTQFLSTAFIPFMLLSAATDTTRKQYVIFVLMVIALLIMVHNGHYQVISEDNRGWVGNTAIDTPDGKRIRYVGVMSDPNDMGMFFVMMLPVIFLLKERTAAVLRWVWWLVLGADLYGIYHTNSRGTLLSTILLLGIWYLRRFGMRTSIVTGAIFTPAMALVFARFRAIDSEEESAAQRIDAWYAGYEMFRSSPLFGVGAHQFVDHHMRTAHNSYILVFAELGLFGGSVWTALIVATLLILWNIAHTTFLPLKDWELNEVQEQRIAEEKRLAVCLLYSFVGFLATAFFLSRAYIPLLYIFIALTCACYMRVMKIFPKKAKVQVIDMQMLAKLSGAAVVATLVGIYLIIVLADN